MPSIVLPAGVEPMTCAEAGTYAPQWGSMITAGDPGACMYGFDVGDGRPQTEKHRAAVLSYMTDCRERAASRDADDQDLVEIDRFLSWMQTAPLRTEDPLQGYGLSSATKIRTPDFSITYGTVFAALQATGNNPYPMTIRAREEWAAIAQCVNQGIDATLEAIVNASEEFLPGGTCCVTLGNMCVLLRRLGEGEFEDAEGFSGDEVVEAAEMLQGDILQILGFDEYGNWRRDDVDSE